VTASRKIEIHDSELTSVKVSDGHIILELSPAYIHMSEGRPGIDAGTGWIQNAVIRVRGDAIAGSMNRLPCDLSDGYVKVNGDRSDNLIPIPLVATGYIELHLTSIAGESFRVRGDHITLELLGEPEYMENFPGV
jgi:hypothetical protein